ncbi:unnamed protein product [Symbiodinium microadriaticum]|nr:unnamed protein product [Symbiodinium microadriaticum]
MRARKTDAEEPAAANVSPQVAKCIVGLINGAGTELVDKTLCSCGSFGQRAQCQHVYFVQAHNGEVDLNALPERKKPGRPRKRAHEKTGSGGMKKDSVASKKRRRKCAVHKIDVARVSAKEFPAREDAWDMDVLADRMRYGWTLSWSGHGCSGRTDGVWVDVIMVGTWMLWQKGRSLWERYQSWLGHGYSVGPDGVCGTLSRLGYGCCVGTDGVCVNVIMDG